MTTIRPSPVALASSSLTELFLQRRESTVDPIRFVTDVRPGFVERPEASDVASRATLYSEAARAGSALRARGVGPGDTVLLLLPSARDFLRAFFACQLLGAIPVPLVPPWSLARMRSHTKRIIGVARVCTPRATIAGREVLAPIQAFVTEEASGTALGDLITPAELEAREKLSDIYRPAPSDTAFIQFTSGSTTEPRGVELSHAALLANCYAIGESLGFDEPGHLGCSWLPLFHDMGLIGHVLVPLLWQIPTVLMPPESFTLRPISWLQAVAGFGATISTAPNFAYQLSASRLDRAKTQSLDLSRWRVALCGGEPVLADTLDQFSERFAENGFRRQALCPVYGLAESTLAVTLSSPHKPAHIEHIDRSRFAETGEARLLESADALRMVGCGRVPPNHRIEIRDDSGNVLTDGWEGNIWVSGPSLMSGYYRNEDATRACLSDGWLSTGDRGYVRDGELFVTGRAKEIIFKGGRNLYPQEIEAAAGRVNGIRAGRVAAFGVPDAEEGTDRMIVAAERRDATLDEATLQRGIMEEVMNTVAVRPDEVVILPAGTLTKTSSGKMQRLEAQRRYLEDALQRPQARMTDAARLLLARIRFRFAKR